MKRTPHALIAFGFLLLVFAYYSFVQGIVFTGIDQSVASAADLAAERLSLEELRRVFDMPIDADPTAWLENSMGRHWTRGLASGAVAQTVLCVLGSVVFIGWGWAEFLARRDQAGAVPAAAIDGEAIHSMPD